MKKIFVLIILAGGLLFLTAGLRKAGGRNYPSGRNPEAEGDRAFQDYEIEKARQYWREALTLNPGKLKLYNKLGISYLLLKENEKAVDILEQGLEIDGDNLSLNYNLALAHYYSGNFGTALEALDKVLRLKQGYPEANYLRGLCLEEMGREEEARAAYVEELNNNPGSRGSWRKIRKEP